MKGRRPSAAALAPGAETLAAAVVAVGQVVHEGRSADVALAFAETRTDRAAVRAIALGTLRWYLRLAPALAALVARPADELVPALRALLVTAAHQIEYSRAAPEVSVHLAVDAARALGLAPATGLVNAVLRRFVRERQELLTLHDAQPATRYAHPEWLVERVFDAWPEHAEKLLIANNAHPPMTLRVARHVASTPVAALDATAGDHRDAYLRELASIGRMATSSSWAADALVLEHAAAVTALPGFREGRVSVQDAGAQLAAALLELAPGQRVLDACAAPGGKTAHILQTQPDLDLLAVDIDAERLALVESTLMRIGVAARTRVADLAAPDALVGEASFDRILLDAPCSSTGVIRRHPDIKLLRRQSDIGAFSQLQAELLRQCFARLAPGGRLLYATCSVLPEENSAVVTAFLRANESAESLPWPVSVAFPPGAVQLEEGVQLLPGGEADSDGFYYACIGRRSEA